MTLTTGGGSWIFSPDPGSMERPGGATAAMAAVQKAASSTGAGMPHRRLARIFLVVLIATLLCAPAWATPGRSSEARLFDVLARLWGSFTAVWAEHGCKLDPNGGCAAVAEPTTDSGCKIDPNGGCAASQATSDEGCALDPHGGCTPGS